MRSKKGHVFIFAQFHELNFCENKQANFYVK